MASSQTLTTKAVIEAVDRLTGPLKSMGGQINAFALGTQKRLDSLGASYAKLGSTFSKLPLAGGAFGAGFALHGVMDQMMEFDKKLRQVAAVNLLTKGQMVGLQGTIADITDKTGVLPEKVLEAAEAYQQLNGDLKNFNEVAKIAARTSVITGSDMAHQITAISAAGKAFGLDMKNAANARDIENTFLVAAKGMRGGMPAFEQAIKTAGPVAKQLYGWDLKETAALIQTLGGQFEAGEIGTAIKSVGARLQALPRKALMQLGVAGGDVLSLMGADPEKAKGLGGNFARALSSSGFAIDGQRQAQFEALVAQSDVMTKEGRDKLRSEYMKIVEKMPGHAKKGGVDGKDREKAIEAFNQSLAAIQGDHVSPTELLKTLDSVRGNKALMAGLFGKEHLPKWLDLLVQQTHVQERINHIRKMVDSTKYGVGYTRGTGTFTLDKDDAIAQRWKLFENAPSTQYGRMMGNIQAFWNDVSGRGVGASLAGMFKAAADFARELQKADPKVINGIFKGLLGAAAIPASVFAISTLGGALATLGGAGIGVVAMFGRLAATTAVLPWMLEATGAAVATRLSPALGGAIGLLGRFGRGLAFLSGAGLAVGAGFYAYEHWAQIMQNMKDFSGTDTGKAMFGSFKELGSTLAPLADDMMKLLNRTMEWLNLKPEGGAFKDWLDLIGRAVTVIVQGLTGAVNFARKLAGGLGVKSDVYDYLLGADREHVNELQRWSDSVRDSSYADALAVAAAGRGVMGRLGGTEVPGVGLYAGEWTVPNQAGSAGWGDSPFGSAGGFERSQPLGMGSDVTFANTGDIVDPVVAAQGDAADKITAAQRETTNAINAMSSSLSSAVSGAISRAGNAAPRAPAPAMGGETGGKR